MMDIYSVLRPPAGPDGLTSTFNPAMLQPAARLFNQEELAQLQGQVLQGLGNLAGQTTQVLQDPNTGRAALGFLGFTLGAAGGAATVLGATSGAVAPALSAYPLAAGILAGIGAGATAFGVAAGAASLGLQGLSQPGVPALPQAGGGYALPTR